MLNSFYMHINVSPHGYSLLFTLIEEPLIASPARYSHMFCSVTSVDTDFFLLLHFS